MLHEFIRISKLLLLLIGIFMISTEIVSDLDEPDGGADEDVEMFGVGLHGRDGLNGAGAAAYDGDAVVFPLLCLVVFWPASCMDDLS